MIKQIKQAALIVSLILLLSMNFMNLALAATYGDGAYGGNRYGAKSLTPAGPTQCSDVKPSSTPWLYAAIAKNNTSVLLQFTQVENNVDKYALEFGTESGNYIYAADSIGNQDTKEYLVQDLQPNTTYYFRVRASNGCATGDWSNELSAATSGSWRGGNLQIVETKLEPVISEEENTCNQYIVQPGDSLWSIAESELGSGALYTKISELNQENYPSISRGLEIGWKLNLCQPEETEAQIEEKNGYTVNVKVRNTKQEPVQDARVTIHSKVQEATTDENGIARFENVEPGDHRVLISYFGHEGEQSINLTGNAEEFNLNITIQQRNALVSPVVLSIIGGLVVVIAILSISLARAAKRKSLA